MIVDSICPVCRSSASKVIIDGGEETTISELVGSSRKKVVIGKILECRVCGFGFRQVRPSEEELSVMYQNLEDSLYEEEVAGRSITALRHLELVQEFASSGRLLDVGCATGIFLELAANQGWQVVGLEPATNSCQIAEARLGGRGKVIPKTFQQADLPSSSFDVVTLWDVLEHVSDPIGVLISCHHILKPGGYLFVNVPDLGSMQARLLKSKWPLFLNEHLNYFTRNSLRICGEKSNLRIIRYGRRPVSFSIEYILKRLSQHNIFGTNTILGISAKLGLQNKIVDIPMGELYCVWCK